MVIKVLSWFGFGVDWLVLKGVKAALDRVRLLNGIKTILGLLVLAYATWVEPSLPPEYADVAVKAVTEICLEAAGQCEAVKHLTLVEILQAVGGFLLGLGVFHKALKLPAEGKPLTPAEQNVLASGLPPARTY